MIRLDGQAIVWQVHGEIIRMEPWGEDAIRVRARPGREILELLGGLEPPAPSDARAALTENGGGELVNGRIRAEIHPGGGWRCDRAQIAFYNRNGDMLLEELRDPDPLYLRPHQYDCMGGDDFHLTCSFESDPEEKLCGMGQYQQHFLNIKGCMFELTQQNTQVSVPFVYSSRGYGFLWNNPAVGQATFGKNRTCWTAQSTKQLDYWICAGNTPAEVHATYMKATGLPPVMPEYGLGFWQSKCRYWNQEQVLSVAREYARRKIPVDVFVIDYFHWPYLGDFRFDRDLFPDPAGMVRELKELGMEAMISVWTPIDERSENYAEMREQNMLVTTDHGVDITNRFFDADAVCADMTSPETRKYIWNKLKQNYLEGCGIHLFWLDEAEPNYTRCDYETYRYALGPASQVTNIFPRYYSQMVSDGLHQAGYEGVPNLVRCAWVGSQKYGALVWSGDIPSTWDAFRNQVCAGQEIGMAGIPWWTTDIGGFKGGYPEDPQYRELITRWMQWGVFCPVMRLHGCREPQSIPRKSNGAALLNEGAPNEIWSYGEETGKRLEDCIRLRQKIRGYVREIMQATHETGEPLLRPMFFDFPEDKACWDYADQHMFGPDILVAPILEPGQKTRTVYLPAGVSWMDANTGNRYEGGREVSIPLSMDSIPVFLRDGRQRELFLS